LARPLSEGVIDVRDVTGLAEIRDAVRLALRFAQQHRPITFDDAARERWIDTYEQLSTARPGLAGAATARAEAHTVPVLAPAA
jgi:hypothetical protein